MIFASAMVSTANHLSEDKLEIVGDLREGSKDTTFLNFPWKHSVSNQPCPLPAENHSAWWKFALFSYASIDFSMPPDWQLIVCWFSSIRE